MINIHYKLIDTLFLKKVTRSQFEKILENMLLT